MLSENTPKQAVFKAAKAIWRSFPILLGAMMLVALANTLIPKEAYSYLFFKNALLDSFIGSAIGSILAGNPITSYIIGGELLTQGISMTAVTAFIVAWVTVGMIQLPAESILLGKRFAITRNIAAFVFSILVAIITTAIVSVI